MVAKSCGQWHHMCELFVPHGQAVRRVKFHLNLFRHFRDFLRFFNFFFLNNMAAESCDQWRHDFFFSVDHFIPRWPSKIFILIGCRVLHMQLWHHNEGTYDVIKKNLSHSPWGVLAICHLYTHGLGNTCVKFPLDLTSRSGEDFYRF